MKRSNNKYIPVIVFIVLLLITWAEEIYIGEGHWHQYLSMPEHKIFRFIIRGCYLLIVFCFGYFGLSFLPMNWPKKLWIVSYALAFLAAGLRIIIDILFPRFFSFNLFNFFSEFYIILFTPFPYLFLWAISFLFSKIVSKNSNGDKKESAANN